MVNSALNGEVVAGDWLGVNGGVLVRAKRDHSGSGGCLVLNSCAGGRASG